MFIANKTKERGTVILAVLTLLVIGISILLSTRQTLRHQREAEDQHLYLTARAVLISIENMVRRGPVREGENRLTARTVDFFQTLEQDGDVLFVGITDNEGGKMLTAPIHGSSPILLPPTVIEEMMTSGSWHGRLNLGNNAAYIYAKKLESLPGMHLSLRDAFGPLGFLVVGIDLERQLKAYRELRQSVIYQGVYILLAALLTLGLGISFLARREQASKAVALELFQGRLLTNLPDGLITLDLAGAISSANPAALHILNLPSQDVIGKHLSILQSPIAAPLLSISGPTESWGWQRVELGHSHLEILSLPLTDDNEHSCLVIIRDRTMLHDLERSLAEAEKLAAVGTLAAGVAHEVRNPLSSLRGFAQYFVKKLKGRQPEEEYAKTMVREADRLNRVITDLLFLAKPKIIAAQRVNLEHMYKDITALLRFDLEQKNTIIDARLEALFVYADPEALKQALLNLFLNSLDALEEKKFMTAQESKQAVLPIEFQADDSQEIAPVIVHTGVDPTYPSLPDPYSMSALCMASGQADGGVWIEVRDKGCGMSIQQKSQAFEPFFTAKSNGTGLGLALVHRTMLDHAGSVRIASESGKGCAIRLFFPDKTA